VAAQLMARDSLVLPHPRGSCEPRFLQAGKKAGSAGDPCRSIWLAVPLSDAYREYLAKRKELLAEKHPFAPEGKLLRRVDEFPNINQKYIACWPMSVAGESGNFEGRN